MGLTAACARKGWTALVGGVRVQPLFDPPRREGQGKPPHPRLESLKVQPVNGPFAYEDFYLSDDFRIECFFEAPFLASPAEAVSDALRSASQS